MGNTNPTLGIKGSVEYGGSMKGRPPLLYHRIHSENVQLSLDGRKARRVESFCKGICFSDRPVQTNERVHLCFSEVSTSWSGVIRLGFTSHDPTTLNAAELPRYACPDLTYKPGFWAKALPERYAEQGTTLYYYLTRSGDVMFGINGEEKGLFFGSVATNCQLWALVDIYGNTTCMEFIDGWQMNNLETGSGEGGDNSSQSELDSSLQQQLSITAPPPVCPAPVPVPPPDTPNPTLAGLPTHLPPVTYHYDAVFTPLPFHYTMGKNVCLSSDRSLAVRMVEEYCNGYVFTQRPLLCEEALIIQILSLETDYAGGLAFGLTACDPLMLSPDELPDDSDLLLDRPEYWVVNKDVCTSPQVGDELSFYLTQEGEVRYGKNGHHIATLMYIDKTLPLWAFFDVYGNTQKIRSLGTIQPDSHGGLQGVGSGLTVALPPPRTSASPASPSPASATSGTVPSSAASLVAPPRPPPPRASPSGATATSAPGRHSLPATPAVSSPPTLPPKLARSGSHASPLHPALLLQSQHAVGSPLPPPLIPTPLRGLPPSVPERHSVRPHRSPPHVQPAPQTKPSVRPAKPLPQVPLTPPLPLQPAPPCGSESCDENLDNENNECKVCMNNAVDCVLYTCGHMCLCFECAQDIKNKHNLCPICRQDIKDIIRIYKS